ncbi:helix-turn-helix domain-containing protein [Herbihabitans rhizosphaerae]|uniref:helix-turn-helix domain-containing protein n=1 Tax=Herbihabitans rhizosphaerae TaxID=1872711 RepID=UPI001F5E3E30|nr:helix-turn-helix transcriptional regulator [Herbihabitans rhizosphaerae]
MARQPTAIVELRRALGERLAAFRKGADLRQADLARHTSYHRSTVAHIETGRTRADARFWQTADQATGADGALLAEFHRLETAEREHELSIRETALASARAKVERFQLDTIRKCLNC